MLNMAEKTLLGLMVMLSFTLIGVIVFPVSTFEVGLVTSPNTDKVYLPAGTPFNITCKGSGDDAKKFSSLKWLNTEGKVIPKGIRGTILDEDNSLTLIFTETKETDSGVYKCVAEYEKKNLQKSVTITFHGTKPLFKDYYGNITALENTTVEILCAAEGELPIEYEWYNEIEEKIEENSQLPIYVKNTVNGSILIITNVTLSNKGLYTCLARNKHGLSSKIFDLTILSKGGVTTNETISLLYVREKNITTRSVTFDLKFSEPVRKILIRYKELLESQYKLKEFTYGDVYEIKDLLPSGLYSFQFSTFPNTTDEWSMSYTVVLLPSKPEVIFQNIDSGTVKLKWLVRSDDKWRKTINWHEISYFTVQPDGEKIWKPSTCAIRIQIPECAENTYTLSGMSVNVYYEIQVRAHTQSGYSEPYTQKIFMKK